MITRVDTLKQPIAQWERLTMDFTFWTNTALFLPRTDTRENQICPLARTVATW